MCERFFRDYARKCTSIQVLTTAAATAAAAAVKNQVSCRDHGHLLSEPRSRSVKSGFNDTANSLANVASNAGQVVGLGVLGSSAWVRIRPIAEMTTNAALRRHSEQWGILDFSRGPTADSPFSG